MPDFSPFFPFVPASNPLAVSDKFYAVVKEKNVYLTVVINLDAQSGEKKFLLSFGIEPISKQNQEVAFGTSINRSMNLGFYPEENVRHLWREASMLAMILMTEGHNVFVGVLKRNGTFIESYPAYELYEDHIERVDEEKSKK
jgi:hypothetical protein